jgi:type IV secretory pathway VirB2 component (pilin)
MKKTTSPASVRIHALQMLAILSLNLSCLALTRTASASGVDGIEVATTTVQKIVDLLTGELATVAFLLIIVLGGIAWWITRTSRAGEIIGRTIVGAVIIFGAVQISDYFAFQGASI